MPVTIKDIAREADVSHSTVSRALNGSRLISTETTERVQKIAAALGYLPSAAARTLKTNHSRVLGVIVRNIDDPFFSEILQGIEEVAQAHDYSLFMAASRHDHKIEKSILRAMVERRVEGVIICSTPVSTEQSRQLTSYGVPIVVVNNQAAEAYRYSIYHDDRDGSQSVTDHLLELGHRDIAYLGNADAGRSTQDRLIGYQQALQAARVVINPEFVHQVHGGKPENGLAATDYFLALPHRPTAIVCYNDMLALGVLQGLRTNGLRVPEDISVTGFDNIFFSGYTDPPLTTFDQPKRFIGAEAARLVLELLDAGGTEGAQPEIHMLKGRLLLRASTAVPPMESS
jgi:DNA-binding LacI/PurR family transcriptional regulator